MSKAITATLVPLFDRLAGALHISTDGRLLDGAGLQQSLERDLLRLFNVRNAMGVREFLEGEPTVLDYGLPDMLGLSAQSDQDCQTWARVIERSIALYEPRLAHVRVAVVPDRSRPTRALAAITAVATLGEQRCRVSFDVGVDARSASLREAA